MELNQYQQYLAKLVKDPIEILNSLNPYKVNMLHAASALLGELAELADAKTHADHKEEFGDAVFYLEALAAAVKEYPQWEDQTGCAHDLSSASLFDVSDYKWNPNVHWKSNLVIAAGNLFDVVKKHVFYNKPITRQMVLDFRVHWKAVRYLIEKHAGDKKFCGWTMEELRQSNIDKLSLRYPGLQFTDAAADKRADKIAMSLAAQVAGESELPNEPSTQVETGASVPSYEA
jgi:hypothetical protein